MPQFRTLYFTTIRILIIFVILVCLSLAGLYTILTRSVPNYSKAYNFSGINEKVTIVRDTYAIPHIIAENDQDAYFALGVAHAQDRLWQMMVLRRTAQGRLSEVFGRKTLETDDLMRRLDIYNLAEQSISALPRDVQGALKAYSRGVNAWIKTINAKALGRGAPEFFIFPNTIRPWRPTDSVALGKLLAFMQSDHLAQETLHAQLMLALPKQRVKDLMPGNSNPTLIEPPKKFSYFERLKLAQNNGSLKPTLPNETAFMSPVSAPGMAGASNAWTAAPHRSARGGTLLATDPHLKFSTPSLWYLAKLGLETGPIIGATIPGMPVIIIGRNDHLGWGVTTTGLDDADIVMEKINPKNQNEYLSPQGSKPFTKRKTQINIKGEEPQEITLLWTENGPVLPPQHFDLEKVTPPGHVASILWTGLTSQDTTPTAYFRLMSAQNIDEALQAAQHIIAPAQNLIVADKTKIAFQMMGRIPRRHHAQQGQGQIPVLGTEPKNLWSGFYPFSLNPKLINPKSGLIGNTNNQISDQPFPHHISHSPLDSVRILRLRNLMDQRTLHTRESFIEAQSDYVSPAAQILLPLVARNLWFSDAPHDTNTPEGLRKAALDLLAEWRGDMTEHAPEPLIFNAWMRELQQHLLRDEIGALRKKFLRYDVVFLERVFRDTDGAGAWCDIIQTQKRETCDQIAKATLDMALGKLNAEFGSAIESWRWGDSHFAVHPHPALGKVEHLKWLVNIVHPVSGGDYTLSRMRSDGTDPNPFVSVHGSQFRGIYDFSDPNSSVYVISTGQSGHPLSRHYDDLSTLWRRGEYIPMSTDTEIARAGAVGITTLTPSNNK